MVPESSHQELSESGEFARFGAGGEKCGRFIMFNCTEVVKKLKMVKSLMERFIEFLSYNIYEIN